MSISPERKLFDSAHAYYLGATILMKPPSQDSPDHLVQPAMTCASLSLKLYLKCLHTIDGRDNDDTYLVAELFRSLKSDVKKLVLEKYDEFANVSLSEIELLNHLEALDSAFIRWRYIREDDARSVNLEDLEEMMLAARATILSIRPEWQA